MVAAVAVVVVDLLLLFSPERLWSARMWMRQFVLLARTKVEARHAVTAGLWIVHCVVNLLVCVAVPEVFREALLLCRVCVPPTPS